MNILFLDIGSGTQDALYYTDTGPIENCPKFVLPSPERLVATRIRELAGRGVGVHLVGTLMGGGFKAAVLEALEAGVPVSAHPAAGLALADNLTRLAGLGLRLSERRPPHSALTPLADFDPGFWRAFLALAGLSYPDLIVAAAQDHGFHPAGGNRAGRFEIWKRLLAERLGRPESLLYATPPAELTRLAALQQAIGGGLVADTGAAAVLSGLFDSALAVAQRERGICLVNAGNSHTLGFLLFEDKIWGVYEQHTGALTLDALLADLKAFRRGAVDCATVWNQGGHGCLTLDLPLAARGFEPLYVIGPRRGLFAGSGCAFPAPGGDVMLAGCFGLLEGYRRANSQVPPSST